MRHTFQKKHKVHTTTKLKKGYQQACSDHKDLPHLLSTSVSSHHNPLLSCHSPCRVREGISCRDSRSLCTITQLPGLMHFLAQHVQGHVGLCQLPILQAKRDLVTRPIQPDDLQRLAARIAFSGATQGHTPPTTIRLHFPALDSLGSPFSIRLPYQVHDIQLLRLFLLPQLRVRQ